MLHGISPLPHGEFDTFVNLYSPPSQYSSDRVSQKFTSFRILSFIDTPLYISDISIKISAYFKGYLLFLDTVSRKR